MCKKVWSSIFTPRAIAFRATKGLDVMSDELAVGVVQMINARVAGVAFTADPNTGNTSVIIIDANWGLGESVVGSGADCGTPDHWIIDKNSFEILRFVLGEKKRAIRCAVDHEGTLVVDLSSDEKCYPCLSHEEIQTVADTAYKLEKTFGHPVDVEWSIDQEGVLYLLQCRPLVVAKKNAVDVVVVVDYMITQML